MFNDLKWKYLKRCFSGRNIFCNAFIRILWRRYEGAVLLETQVRESLEKQEWQTVIDLTDPIVSSLPQEFESNPHDLELPHFLRRFTAAAVYVYTLNKRIEALQRLKQYQSAVDVLSMLIKQECYLLTHRGHWYERIILNTEQHLKNPIKVPRDNHSAH